MTKVAVVFTDTPDGGYDIDVLPLEGPVTIPYTPATGAALIAAKLYTDYMKSQGVVVTEESGVMVGKVNTH